MSRVLFNLHACIFLSTPGNRTVLILARFLIGTESGSDLLIGQIWLFYIKYYLFVAVFPRQNCQNLHTCCINFSLDVLNKDVEKT